MQTLVNWGGQASWRDCGLRPTWEKDKTIDNQILDPATSVCQAHPDMVQLGDDCFVKVLSAKRLPDVFYFGEAIQYVGDLSGQNQGLHQNYAVVMNVLFPNQDAAKGSLEKKRQWVTQQAYGPLLKFVPVLADKKASFDTIYESLQKGARPIRTTYSVILFGESEREVTSASMGAVSFWATQRFKLMADKFVMLPMLRNSLPLGTDIASIKEL